MKTSRWQLALLCLASCAAWATPHAATAAAQTRAHRPFAVEDYFKLRTIHELAVSSDGRRLAYIWQRQALEDNRTHRQLIVESLERRARPLAILDAQAISGIAWVPGSRKLAFLSDRSGKSQVLTLDERSGEIASATNAQDPVESFRYSPDGRAIAYTMRTPLDVEQTVFHRLRRGDAGILADTDVVDISDFMSGAPRANPAPASLWVSDGGGRQSRLAIDGDVQDFRWADAANLLSVTYVAAAIPAMLARTYFTSVAVIDPAAGIAQVLCAGAGPSNGQPGQGCSGGEWVVGRAALMIRRMSFTDIWASDRFPEWAIVQATGAQAGRGEFRRTAETYNAVFHPLSTERVWVESTERGVRWLREWTADGTRRVDLGIENDGSSSRFSLSRNGSTLAFVNESLGRPPEIYVRRASDGRARQWTHLNDPLLETIRPIVREVSWAGRDGMQVSGWVLLPRQPAPERGFPLVTMVHGGPSYVFPNQFAPFFIIWPYPFEALTSQGIAVFVPNYRGTGSFGEAFATVRALDKEPVDDIVSGIESLVAAGVADRYALALAGHSHGAWLAPLIVARNKSSFKAAAFAEGAPNLFTMYALLDARANREIHDVKSGDPYRSPQRYIEMSPDLNYSGVRSATLIEVGAQSQAIYMLSLAKAARRTGAPTEFVIYPRSGHALALPRLQKEASERHLDWFRYWLKGEESTDRSKISQYQRWHAWLSRPALLE